MAVQDRDDMNNRATGRPKAEDADAKYAPPPGGWLPEDRMYDNDKTGLKMGHVLLVLVVLMFLMIGYGVKQAVMPQAVASAETKMQSQVALPQAQIKEIQGYGETTLEKLQGHFFVDGTIGDVPVRFLIDTGASYIAISPDVAKQAGVTDCRSARFDTANGQVMGCIGHVDAMSFSKFGLRNVEVAVAPGLEGALLGMNALGEFDLQQMGNMLKISRR